MKKELFELLFTTIFNCCFSYEYEVIVVPGDDINDAVKPIIKTVTKEPPIFITPQDLGGSSATYKTFTMGVRLRSQQVSIFPYFSDFH